MKRRRHLTHYLALAFNSYALLGALISISGWIFDMPRLTDWGGTTITMKANTALCMAALAGAALLLQLGPAFRPVILWVAALVAAMGMATLVQHLLDVDLGIDTLLFDEPPGSPATASPNRMGPPAALSFMLLAAALWLAARASRSAAVVVLPLVVLAIATLSLVGYLYNATPMYTAPRLTGIAVQTASMLASLACGLLMAQPHRQPFATLAENSTAGELARRLIPFAIITPVLLGYLRLEGQRAHLFDAAFGTALRTVVEMVLLTAALWWAIHTIRGRDRQRRETADNRYRELREADRRKDEFLATLAHELRNPLAPIRAAVALARKSDLAAPRRKWCNDVIDRQVHHMALLLDDLLDVSRITRGTLELRRVPVSLVTVVESALETSRPLLDAKRHLLTVELTASAVVNVDPLRISQVVSNLLNNAAKYTPPGGSIQLTAKVQDADLAISVTDNGIGIARADLDGIFNMFSQVRSAREGAVDGLGIGLALTRGLVHLHGGTTTAHSDGAGRGSTFSVHIPDAVAQLPQLGSPPGPAAAAGASLKILIADDNRDAVEALALLLGGDGHEVLQAADGEAALQLFRGHRPDVVLLDIGMPHMNGLEAARRIRELDSQVRLIAITGWGQQGDRERSAAAGFDHHLTKPVDYDTLIGILGSSPRQALQDAMG